MARDLVVFGEDWGAHPSSTQHIVRRLAADRRVLWVNSIGLRRPRLDGRDLRRVSRKLAAAVKAPPTQQRRAPPPPSLTVHAPVAVSWPGSPVAAAFNRHALGLQLRRAIAAAGLRDPILWSSLPTAAPLVGALGERGVVYYCGDDFGALAGVDHEPVARMERALVERADIVFAASEALADRLPAGKTQLAPHGVDVDLFATPAPRPADLPHDRPVAGFYGALADWIDVEMIAHAADALPDWSFVLIGPEQTDVSLLRARDNVRLLGPRDHAELAGYAQHWSVSLLPFRDNAQIRACNPLKLREYLAAGTPIATTDFPALAPYADLASVAASPADFADAIRRAAQDGARAQLRRARVKDESWDARAAAVSHALDSL